MRTESSACTDIGRRQNNEDAHCALPQLGLFAVADGMGGYEGGEVASQLVIHTLSDFYERNEQDHELTWPFSPERGLSAGEGLFHVAVRLANQEVVRRRTGRLSEMGSTLAALVLRGEKALIGHVGDSRVYRLRNGELVQLTRDHSLYEEMRAAGLPSLPAKKDCGFANVITRAIGLLERSQADLRTETVLPGDVYLLCTDGLSEMIGDDDLCRFLTTLPKQVVCEKLVREAHARGGKDNITAVVVRVEA